MREDKQMTIINPDKEQKKITSYSNHNKQPDDKDDRLTIFVDISSTITTEVMHVISARETYMHTRKLHTLNYAKSTLL